MEVREGQVLQGLGWESHDPYGHQWLETDQRQPRPFIQLSVVGRVGERARYGP